MNCAGTILSIMLACGVVTAGAQDLPALSLSQAGEMALRNNPVITVADLKALAARQVTREARAAYFPNISANVVAVGAANETTRLAAIGALNNPTVFDRNAEGLMISQLITDFGRTAHLTGSARLRAEAEANRARATREQILLAVNGAFYSALQAQALTRVARQTVTTRQTLLDQVTALASNKLRSDLDLQFARVNVEDARLLLSRAQNDLQASFTQLSTLLGEREPRVYRLVEQPLPPDLSTNVADLVQQALNARPDLQAARHEQQAGAESAKGERALRYPTIAAVGSAGVSPIHDPGLNEDAYAAAGVVLSVPIFAGGLYSARQEEARLRAEAATANVRDVENNAIRDVRVGWLNARNAFDRLHITEQLLANARQAHRLAEASYRNGISSMVELNQAELSEVSAEIALTNTRYEYLLQRAALDFQTGMLR